MSKIIETEFPETLYVTEQHQYRYIGLPKVLIGKASLDSQVPDNDRETTVAVYQLVRVEKYQKITTKTSVIKRV
jgi:hypothetical protein